MEQLHSRSVRALYEDNPEGKLFCKLHLGNYELRTQFLKKNYSDFNAGIPNGLPGAPNLPGASMWRGKQWINWTILF